MPVESADEDHYLTIVEKLSRGRMIPFLGAGANLCDRGEQTWARAARFCRVEPSCAVHLAARGRYPFPEEPNLLRVSSTSREVRGENELYRYLREVFDAEYSPTSLHRSLARTRGSFAERACRISWS